VEKFVAIARVHSLLSGATPHYYLTMIKAAHGHESVHVVNINHVLPSGSWIVCVLFYLCILGKTSVVKRSFQRPVATVDRARDWWLQRVWKRRFL